MNNENIHTEQANQLRKRFNDTETVTIKTSVAHLDFLYSWLVDPFLTAIEQEKDCEKKPATKAWETISKKSQEDMRVWLVEAAVAHVVSQYVQKSCEKLWDRVERE